MQNRNANCETLVWLRYIDAMFFIWNENEEKLEQFLNNFHPNLKFTSEKSKKSVNFLDVTVSLIDQHLETDLYYKLTDCHQFLILTLRILSL